MTVRSAISVGFPSPNFVAELGKRDAVLPGEFIAENGQAVAVVLSGQIDAACGSAPGWVVGWGDDICSRSLCRLSVPCEIIIHAVYLYFHFPLGLRMVEELMAARGIIAYRRLRKTRRLTDRRIAFRLTHRRREVDSNR
jgi:hypothetical protein